MKSMRFRVWSNDRKQFVNPDNYVLELTGGLKQIELIKDEFYKPEYPDDPPVEYTEILTHLQSSVIFAGQYTGLKDKNGKEIYEGDVVEWKHAEQGKEAEFYKEKTRVSFSYGSFGFEKWYNDENGFLKMRNIHHPRHHVTPDYYYVDFDIEIIGNIYENPELLK